MLCDMLCFNPRCGVRGRFTAGDYDFSGTLDTQSSVSHSDSEVVMSVGSWEASAFSKHAEA